MPKNTVRKSVNSETCLLRHEYAVPIDLIKRAELLLSYRSYTRKQNKERFLKQLNVKVYERLTFSTMKMIKELQQDALDRVCAVTDFDEEFFKIVNGRLPHYIPIYKSLKSLLNRCFRIRQDIGYKRDSILNIEINFRIEKNIYDLSLQWFTEEAKVFDLFIMEDYQKSMKLLEEGNILNVSLDAKMCELQNLGDQSFAIMSRLIGLDFKYGLQQKYGRFLYYLSPPIWRSKNREFARSVEIEVKGFDFGNSNDEDTFSVMFEKMRDECFRSYVKPVLYFTHPQELMDIFNGMEKQQLYHFSHEAQLIPHIKSLKDGIRMLKEKKNQDSAVVLASIKVFENLLSFCEEQSTQLKKKFFKILNGFFYESVGTAEVLKLTFHLDYCFAKVFNEKPINMDIVTMAKAIELMYMDLSRKLEAIQSDTVRKAMQKCVDMEKRKIFKAKIAAKELRMFNRLEQELLKSHGIIPSQQVQVPVQSNKIRKQTFKRNISKSQVNNKIRSTLTDAETEYLTLFTDWKNTEDPALYLQSLQT